MSESSRERERVAAWLRNALQALRPLLGKTGGGAVNAHRIHANAFTVASRSPCGVVWCGSPRSARVNCAAALLRCVVRSMARAQAPAAGRASFLPREKHQRGEPQHNTFKLTNTPLSHHPFLRPRWSCGDRFLPSRSLMRRCPLSRLASTSRCRRTTLRRSRV